MKYLEPLPVVTTSPFATFPFAIGLVVTLSPSAKALEPEISPVMDPSKFFFQRDIVGTPRGACFCGIGLDGRGACFGIGLEGRGACFGIGRDGLGADALGAGSAFGSPSSAAPKPSPKSENVARGLADSTASMAALASRSFRSRVKVIVAPGLAPSMSLMAAAILAFFTAGSELKK